MQQLVALEALHVAGLILWLGSFFALCRVLELHSDALETGQSISKFASIERSLLYRYNCPGFALAWVSGLVMTASRWESHYGFRDWIVGKLLSSCACGIAGIWMILSAWRSCHEPTRRGVGRSTVGTALAVVALGSAVALGSTYFWRGPMECLEAVDAPPAPSSARVTPAVGERGGS